MSATRTKAFARINWARDQVVNNATSKSILLHLATYADKDTGRCFVKQSTLATVTGYKRPTISDHLHELERDGFIAIRPQTRRDGYRKHNEYLVLFRDGLKWPDGTDPRVSEDDTAMSARMTRESENRDNPVSARMTSRVSEDDTPCQPGLHGRVSEADSMNRQSNKHAKQAQVNKDPAIDFLSGGVQDDEDLLGLEDDQPSSAQKRTIRRGRQNRAKSQPRAEEPEKSSANGRNADGFQVKPNRMAELQERANERAKARA